VVFTDFETGVKQCTHGELQYEEKLLKFMSKFTRVFE
jgi:hypothetical protein